MKNLKSFLPALMRTPYYNSLLDAIEECVNAFSTEHIDIIRSNYSISDGDLETLYEIASSIFSLDRFQMSKMYEFLVELERQIGSENPEEDALARFRQEIQKLPFELKERGTIEQYTYLLDFCDFNYPGIITLTRTSYTERVGSIIPSFNLVNCNSVMSGMLSPRVESVDLIADDSSDIAETLDYFTVTSGEDGESVIKVPTLDMFEQGEDLRTLDRTATSTVSLYRKTLYFGLLITSQSLVYYSPYTRFNVGSAGYEGAPTFHENLGKYYRSFIDLNRRASDVLIFGPLLSLNLGLYHADAEHPGIGTSTNFGRDNRIAYNFSANSLSEEISSITVKFSEDRFVNGGGAYEVAPPDNWTFFYENKLNPRTSFLSDPETGSLVLFSLCKGERNRHYYEVVHEGGVESSDYHVDIPSDLWTEDLTIVLRRNNQGEFEEEEFICALLKTNSYGDLEQTYSYVDGSGEQVYSVTVNSITDTVVNGINYKRISFTSVSPYSAYPITEAIFSSMHEHTKVQSMAVFKNDEEDPWVWVWFKGNTAIELTKGIDMGLYLCIHYNVDISTLTIEGDTTEDAGNI